MTLYLNPRSYILRIFQCSGESERCGHPGAEWGSSPPVWPCRSRQCRGPEGLGAEGLWAKPHASSYKNDQEKEHKPEQLRPSTIHLRSDRCPRVTAVPGVFINPAPMRGRGPIAWIWSDYGHEGFLEKNQSTNLDFLILMVFILGCLWTQNSLLSAPFCYFGELE